MALHLASLWNRGFKHLRNDLLVVKCGGQLILNKYLIQSSRAGV